MLTGGDERGRTQGGNNNAYCQDNEISWFDWEHTDEDLLAFTRKLIALRRDHPVFRRRRWFQGRPIRGTVDIGWFRPDGAEMDDADWEAGFARSLAVFLNGDAIPGRDERGRPIADDWFLVTLNAYDGTLDWTLPNHRVQRWEVVFDTASTLPPGLTVSPDKPLAVAGRSCVVLVASEKAPAP